MQLAFDLSRPPPPSPGLYELWTPDDIFESAETICSSLILHFSEDDRVEWKSSRIDPKDLTDYFSMWANTQPAGGVIIIGVEKDGTLTGCSKLTLDAISAFQEAADNQCPAARYSIKRVPVVLAGGKQELCLVFRVFYCEDKLVETVRGDAFIRSGNKKKRLTEDEKREIRIGRREVSFERDDVNLNYPSDFDRNLIGEFCRSYRLKRGLGDRLSEEQILLLNHLGRRTEAIHFIPNLACSILFSNDPRKTIPGCRIRFMKYDGSTEKTGESLNLIQNMFFDGPLPTILQEAEHVISAQMRSFTRLGSDGKFYTKREYPREAWLEAIVNACAHRSYHLKNMVVFVKMFDNRFVVESPGGFPPPVTPKNIYEFHNPRNPYTMDALFYFDFVMCANEGTNRMRASMLGENLPEPEFYQKEVAGSQVHVVLRNNIEARKEFLEATAFGMIGEDAYKLLTEEERMTLNFVAEKGAASITEIGRLLNRDWTTARKRLDTLVRKGILSRTSVTGRLHDSQQRYVFRKGAK